MIILGGIYGGAFTPTEAASVAVFYSLFVGLFIYRELTLQKVIEALRFTALMAGLLVLLAPAQAFGQLTAYYDVPTAVQGLVTSLTENRFLIMVLIGLFYIAIGTFMESLAQIILFTAVFLPMVKQMGDRPGAVRRVHRDDLRDRIPDATGGRQPECGRAHHRHQH